MGSKTIRDFCAGSSRRTGRGIRLEDIETE
jgi:hypothetical protein